MSSNFSQIKVVRMPVCRSSRFGVCFKRPLLVGRLVPGRCFRYRLLLLLLLLHFVAAFVYVVSPREARRLDAREHPWLLLSPPSPHLTLPHLTSPNLNSPCLASAPVSVWIVQIVVESGVCKRLVQLLDHPSSQVVKPALRTIGNVVCAEDDADYTEAILEAGSVVCLKKLIAHPNREIQKEVRRVSQIPLG